MEARQLKTERLEARMRPEDKALLKPPAPGRRLKAAARRYRALTGP